MEINDLKASQPRVKASPIEIARHIKRLRDRGYTLVEIAEKTCHSMLWIQRTLALLKLPEKIQTLIQEGKICEANATLLLKIPIKDQESWVEDACTMKPGDFLKKVTDHA